MNHMVNFIIKSKEFNKRYVTVNKVLLRFGK